MNCYHGGLVLPEWLCSLGQSELASGRNFAWDIGAAGVARILAERLDATLVLQTYSRLVIDCNRPPAAPDSIPTRSDWVQIEANEQLDGDEREARCREIFEPYHAALTGLLDARAQAARRTLLVAVHSFTPSYRGSARPWQVGVMHRHDRRMAEALLKLLRRDERLVVGDNEPYAIDDDSDYSIPVHGEARGLPHVAIEIRQDLIADEAGQKTWAGRLASMLKQIGASLPAY
ncbi:MAG: N-formylglutamate amidohydrolase [Nevskia sp.]